MDRIEDAIRDLENAISKCTTFAPSHVQKSFAGKDALIFVLLFCGFMKSSWWWHDFVTLFTDHKKAASQLMGMNLPLPQSVLQSYKNCVDMFPDYGDARALYAQVRKVLS